MKSDTVSVRISAYQWTVRQRTGKKTPGEPGHTRFAQFRTVHRLMVRSFPSDYVHTLVYCEFRGTHSAVAPVVASVVLTFTLVRTPPKRYNLVCRFN